MPPAFRSRGATWKVTWRKRLSAGGDYADLYFEYLLTSSIGIDESMVKSASQGVGMGVGVRVIAGERTGYAYSDDLAPGENPQGGARGGRDRLRAQQGGKMSI